jgi:hypothetical protein
MGWIDEDGLLQPHTGDILRVHYDLRPDDYGPLKTDSGLPAILIWHLTGAYMPPTAHDSVHDGSEGMAQRIAEQRARYYAHGILSTDGVFHQNVHLNRSAIAVSGSWQGRETNRIATHVEVCNLGYVRATGEMPGGHKVDLDRDDLRQHGHLMWDVLTPQQASAIIELADAWRQWTLAAVDDCLRGHQDVNPADGHADPGPELRQYLDTVVRAHLEAMTLEVA